MNGDPDGSDPSGGMPAADRLPPPDVAPVTVDGVRYEVIHWGKERGLEQNGGYIAAVEPESGKELWTLKIYNVEYDPEGFGYDMQDVFIRRMRKSWFAKRLEIEDENGRRYKVDLATRQVSEA